MDYKPGAFSASIFEGKKPSSNPVLNDLFSKKAAPVVKEKKVVVEKEQKKSKKKKKHEVEEALKENTPVKEDKKVGGKRKHEEPTSSPVKSKKVKKDSPVSGEMKSTPNPVNFPFIHESLVKKSPQQKGKKDHKNHKKGDDDDDDNDNPHSRRKRNKTADKRTVFVGNCPLTTDKKVLKGLFKDYGQIESIRFRCGPTAKLELPKRAVMIKKEFHEKGNSYVGFVVYTEEEAATKALKMNGHVLEGHHLRVDLASNQNQHDKKKSIFVGNLPFTVNEDDLWSHFEDCGNILNVRVVRDRQTSIGKGIAYIQFDSKDGVVLAQKLNDVEFQERKLRVTRCNTKVKQKTTQDNPKQMKKKEISKPDTFKGKAKDFYSRSDPRPQKRKTNFAPTNQSVKSFRALFEAKKEKRVNRIKNKKQGPKKPDGLSSIFGDIPADMKKLKMDNPKFLGKNKKSKEKKKEKKIKEKKKEKKAKKNAS